MLKDRKNCSACSACLNICSKNAISMKEDEYGFVFPHIDKTLCISCNLCNSICEKLNKINFKMPLKTYILQSKNKKILEKSSSGGVFAELAKYVLSKNGVVFGCAMERVKEGFDVKHIYIEKEEDLFKLQGSKYVQSKIGKSFKQARDFLNEGKLVLFSGTPCQIVGLKSFLGKEYEKLFLVDILCAGVPNQKTLNLFVKNFEEKNNVKIKNILFRDKKSFGWSCNGYTLIDYMDKKHKIIGFEALYHLLFLEAKIIRESCLSCPYSSPLRISDITLGDCWGIEYTFPKVIKEIGIEKKKNGISISTLNTEKGILLFEKINTQFKKFEINLEKIQPYNAPLNRRIFSNDNKDFLELIKKYSFGFEFKKNYLKSVPVLRYIKKQIFNYIPKCLKDLYKSNFATQNSLDCLLMTWGAIRNYGSVLTSYALFSAIKQLGYTTKVINFDIPDTDFARDFIKKNVENTKFCINYNDLRKLVKQTNTFILGSDQQLNYNILGEKLYKSLFFYVPPEKKKAIISGSFGNESIIWDEKNKKYIKILFDRFDYISMREKAGVEIMKKDFDIQSDWVIDPVFLLNKNEYEKLFSDIKHSYKNTIMCYFTAPNSLKNEITQKLKKDFGLPIIDFPTNSISKNSINNKNISVGNWLKSIKESELIITDSFHCLCFAIIFNKKFVCIGENDRFNSLFELFEITNAITRMNQDIVINNANFEKINIIIEQKRTDLLQKLNKIISQPKIISDIQVNAEMELLKISKKELEQAYWFRGNKIIFFFIYYIYLPSKKSLRGIYEFFKKSN